MDLLLVTSQMTRLIHVNTLLFQMNTIGTLQKISSMGEEEYRNAFNLRLINQERIQTPYAPTVTCIKDDMSIHYFDRAMVIFSIWLAHDLMFDRLIGKTRVSMNNNEYETITNERNHSVTPELLAKKWGIGSEKSK